MYRLVKMQISQGIIKMKKVNILKIIKFVFVVLLFSGLFYWFQWRPSQMKKACFKKTQDKVKMISSQSSVVRTYYDMCLHEKGL